MSFTNNRSLTRGVFGRVKYLSYQVDKAITSALNSILGH
jgi:hypothetical protein